MSTDKTQAAPILLVDSNGQRAELLATALEARGVTVVRVPSGFSALTSIERARPACILTRARLQDMSGHELLSLLRRDFALGRLRMVLLVSGEDRTETLETANFEMVIDTDRGVSELARRLRGAVFPGLEGLRIRAARQDHGDVSGTFDVLSFTEVTQAFSQAKKTGRLSLWTDDGAQSAIFFLGGRILHASSGSLTGRTAFAAVLRQSDLSTRFRFRFVPLQLSELAKVPRSIDLLASQLLLAIAVQQDEFDAEAPDQDDPDLRRRGS